MVHKICELYKKIYALSPKIAKKDRFGIYLKIENVTLKTMSLIVEACFEKKLNKLSSLNEVRVKIEILKRMLRMTEELKIIERKNYLDFIQDLQDISKMTNGWIKYLQENPR